MTVSADARRRLEALDGVARSDLHLELDDTELRLELEQIRANLDGQRGAYLAALADPDKMGGEAKLIQARVRQLEAHEKLLTFQIKRAMLVATETGVVISGDWYEKEGVRVARGAPIFELAAIGQLRAAIHVDEADIDHVSEESRGVLAIRARPDEIFAYTVHRIVPVGEAQRGRQVFMVRADLDDHADWMRPGMQGMAKIDAGEARIIWIATHKLIDFLRLKIWF